VKFYKLSESDLPLIFSFSESEIKVWCWLSVHLPFDNSRELEIDTSQLAEEIGISRRSVQRALKTIQENEVFEVEFTKAKVKRKASQMSPSVTDVAEASQVSLKRHRCRRSVTDVAEASQMSQTQPQTLAVQTFENSKIIQTNSDLKDTTEQEPNCCVLEKFEDKLKVYGIHLYIFDEKSEKKNLAGFGISPNPKIATIQEIIKGMPEEKAERAIASFLAWLPTAKNVRCKYAALASSLRENWES
jgi:HTH domain